MLHFTSTWLKGLPLCGFNRCSQLAQGRIKSLTPGYLSPITFSLPAVAFFYWFHIIQQWERTVEGHRELALFVVLGPSKESLTCIFSRKVIWGCWVSLPLGANVLPPASDDWVTIVKPLSLVCGSGFPCPCKAHTALSSDEWPLLIVVRLPRHKRESLDHIQSLDVRSMPPVPPRSLKGIWAVELLSKKKQIVQTSCSQPVGEGHRSNGLVNVYLNRMETLKKFKQLVQVFTKENIAFNKLSSVLVKFRWTYIVIRTEKKLDLNIQKWWVTFWLNSMDHLRLVLSRKVMLMFMRVKSKVSFLGFGFIKCIMGVWDFNIISGEKCLGMFFTSWTTFL